MDKLPSELLGNQDIVAHVNAMRRSNRSLQPMQVPGALVTHSPNGVMVRPIRRPIQRVTTQTTQGLTYFAITSRSHGDSLTCQEVTSIINTGGKAVAHSLSGTDVEIAKQQNMRRSIVEENYDGVLYTYATPTGGDIDNIRTSTDGTNLQTEYPYPRYRTLTEVVADGIYSGDLPMYAQCFILAQKVAKTSGVIVSAAFTEWVEMQPYRVWCAA